MDLCEQTPFPVHFCCYGADKLRFCAVVRLFDGLLQLLEMMMMMSPPLVFCSLLFFAYNFIIVSAHRFLIRIFPL